jgi:hypothetical protein
MDDQAGKLKLGTVRVARSLNVDARRGVTEIVLGLKESQCRIINKHARELRAAWIKLGRSLITRRPSFWEPSLHRNHDSSPPGPKP